MQITKWEERTASQIYWTGELRELVFRNEKTASRPVHSCVQVTSPLLGLCPHTNYSWTLQSLRSLSSPDFVFPEGNKCQSMIFLSLSKKSPNRTKQQGTSKNWALLSWVESQARTGGGLNSWKLISSSSDFLVPMGCNTLSISFAHSLWLMAVCTVTVFCWADKMPIKIMLQFLGEAT